MKTEKKSGRQYRQERERARERHNRAGERREEEEEKGFSFPGNRLGVSPAPIGSQLVGISLFPTVLRNDSFRFFFLHLFIIFCTCIHMLLIFMFAYTHL